MKKKCSFILLFTFMLCIITYPTKAVETTLSNLYVVQTGDTLPSIAKRYNITTHDLKIANGLQSDSLIKGQKLRVPVTYEVLPRDTLQEIALAHHSTVQIIKETNNLTSHNLYPGQILTIKPKKMTMEGQHILMNKEEFKDWLFNQQIPREIHLIQQHHTWKPSYKNFHGNNHFQLLNSMQNHHMKTMGWDNIAQNITTFPDGKVAVSRPLNIAPEGSIGPKANKHGIAIENIGNFDIGHDVMTKEQEETIVYITALLCLKFGLTPSLDTITYHHWWHYKTKDRVLDDANNNDVKSCPGTSFFGGNSTDSAKKYFYPLVIEKMEELQVLDK
ncbi:peptidoglycan recognition family protein [Paucisalibacillus sp. EB02]|uniref:peptidoglycan recognition protein family protein n=1 Tax=Paucisalibacillus sp. EB02 TaxID=1347087 RepID=UPI0009DDCB3C|nr:peptidoglycan recognition family protein [Paucisalibacillus sp. EB02]